MSSRAISSGLRNIRVRFKLSVLCNCMSCALLALDCSAAAKFAPGPENGNGVSSGSAEGLEECCRGEAKRL
jgi:hypothetical protein